MPTAARLAVVADHGFEVRAPRGWELAGELATGASAIVMRLRGKRDRVAALKLGRWRHPDLRVRFAHEAAVLRALGAPVTPTLIDEGAFDDRPYLVMEYIPGETLASWMIDPRRASHVGKNVAVLVQVAETLALVHRSGFVHRDLKPENVMLGDHGTRILDLGLARRPHEPDSTSITDVVGTVHYAAPEQIRAGDLVDQRADLYSLGVIAFELLTGAPPFIGERRAIEYQHCNVKAPRLSRTRAVPRELDDLIAQCMQKQPEARPPSADDIAVRLRRIFEQLRTLPGVGPSSERAKDVMHAEHVAILWVDDHASDAATSVIAEYHGHVVRRMADGLLAIFASSELEQPGIVAQAAARELAATHCVIVHVATAVVRFPVNGAVGAYGDAIEAAEQWSSSPRAIGVTLTEDAAHELGHRAPLPRLATERTSAPFVGRAPLIAEILEVIAQSRSRLITVSGGPGRGKTRVLDEIAAGLQALRREVVHVRAWRGFVGEVGDDAAVLAEISPGARNAFEALSAAAERGAVVVIDDVQWLSSAFTRALVRPLPGIRLVASPLPFGADTSVVAHTAFELARLSDRDAIELLREILQPAELLPLALLERLTVRGVGNPRLLLALARELQHRGAVRRSPAAADWYVADDEFDTLLEPPDTSWLAARVLESIAGELEPTLRTCAGLGASFGAAEATAVTGAAAAPSHLEALCHAGILERRADAYRFANADLPTAIYDHVLDTRTLIHERALAFALAHRDTDRTRWLARVAYHAAGCASFALAIACDVALADHARALDEPALVAALLARGRRTGASIVPPSLAAALDDDASDVTRRR